MHILKTVCRIALGGIVAAEAYAWTSRRRAQCEHYRRALERAEAVQRPLIIFGDRSTCAKGQSLGYRFSVVIPVRDFGPMCEEDAPHDLAEIPDDSAVVLVDGVLEYAPDPDVILAELRRVAGAHLLLGAQLQRWTLTAAALARRTGAQPVSTLQRVGTAGLLSVAVAVAGWPTRAGGGR